MTAPLSDWDLLLLENFSSAVGKGSQPSCSMKILRIVVWSFFLTS